LCTLRRFKLVVVAVGEESLLLEEVTMPGLADNGLEEEAAAAIAANELTRSWWAWLGNPNLFIDSKESKFMGMLLSWGDPPRLREPVGDGEPPSTELVLFMLRSTTRASLLQLKMLIPVLLLLLLLLLLLQWAFTWLTNPDLALRSTGSICTLQVSILTTAVVVVPVAVLRGVEPFLLPAPDALKIGVMVTDDDDF
jgi:hypothetical protein